MTDHPDFVVPDITTRKNAGLAHDPRDFTLPQPAARYTDEDHATWATLFRRQSDMLEGRACREFLEGLDLLGIDAERIPDFERLNRTLAAATGWRLVAVPGLIPDEVFFGHLAERRFPVTWWIREPHQLDYLQEPDVFHDLFGHVPLLAHPVFADYLEAYGKGGMKASRLGALPMLARLYWYTVEFGLIREGDDLRIYGAGIVSSRSESVYCLDSASPNRIGFDLERVIRTRYRIDTFQKTYFVIDDFAQLFDATAPDFTPIYHKLAALPTYGAGDIAPGDTVLQAGNREGWADTDDL
ncbi:phenylalanine 4-monooxygenase [Paludibacterium paludis]|uniref:Phenylalanine-4-hydroxylase n=1 Tax=Paludibacterium paludis TaxID=1225769 RepID=A0A918U8Z5_9NEIS|nr:phenylalanine 4-monooxygenase [Paludibacterium paludis]GGY12039.1 phenylalanine 4-monooxygenase [Paludibacterium paludis]